MPWKIEKPLAPGGMGEVFLALTPEGERVVVKTVSASGSSERLADEIRLLAKIQHPHIVAFRGCLADSREIFGEDKGLSYWMDYVEGDDLLAAAKGKDPATVFGWLSQALEALRYLHAQGILHGDLSPRNILIDRDGNLKLLDFGLAGVFDDSSRLTAATLPYLAPERLSGVHHPASDLFSLGTIFYEALAGRHPRAGAQGLHDLSTTKPESLGTALSSKIIGQMIEADLAQRLRSAEDALIGLKGGTAKDRAHEAVPFHSVTFWGAETFLEKVTRALKEGQGGIFALHGPTGVGKKRFLREIALQATLVGVPVTERRDGKGLVLLRSLHTWSLTELSHLLSLRREKFENGRLIILEWNDDFLDEESRTFFSHLVAWPEVGEIPLTDLEQEAVHGMTKSALGSGFSEKIADRLFKQTGGNPELLVEALGRLRSGGPIDEGMESLGSRRELLLWKITALSEAERDVLAAVACTPEGAPLSDIARIVPDPGLSLRRLVERHLLRAMSGLYRPSHPLVVEVMQDLLDPAALNRLHRRWWEAFKDSPHPHPQRLHHALALKDETEVSAGARPLLDLLWRQERKKEALPLVDRCLEVVKDRVETARLLKEKMNLLADLGRYQEALNVAETWFTLGPDNDEMPLKTVKYWFITGMNHQNLDHDEEAESRLRRCLETGDPKNSDHRPFLARAHSLLGLLDLHRGELAAARSHLQEALELTESKGRRRAEIHRHLAEVAAASSDEVGALRALNEAKRLYEEDGFDQGVFACLLQEGNLALSRDVVAAEAAYARAEAIVLRLDNEALLARVWHNRGVLERGHGRWAESLRWLSKARDVFEMLNHRQDLAECLKNIRSLEDIEKEKPEKETVMNPQNPFDWEPLIARLTELNRELLREVDMDIVLRRLMDSAMELAKAQHGFLLLRADAPDAEAPIPGFTVAVARNLKRESLKNSQNALSLSVVHRAMETGELVATDNALQDPRFKDAPSVHLGQFKSILALPLHGTTGILGVFYLDHSLQDGLFQGDVLKALKLFAGLASIALQKGRMIEELEEKNENLNHTVDEQASQLARLEHEVSQSRLQLKNEYSEIVGRSPKMAEVLTLVDKVTDAKVPVWIYGESGTGKEAIARALHFNSTRKAHPFVTENCSALPESLLESELFGHKKGAFTHATADKKGLLHYADKGTIFLDEIADMSPNLQAKLLRFLQEGEIRPIGSHQMIKVDVRVVSASNKDLQRLAREGKFREDLFFRLNGITVKLPALRERLADLPLLADHFLKGKATLHPEALRLLMAYTWPGNVRELQQTLETAALFAEGGMITSKSLEFKEALFRKAPAIQESRSVATGEGEPPLTPDLERILRAIREQCYNKAHAAKALGMSRRHLYTKLEQYGVSPESASLKAYIDKHLGS